MVKVSERTVLVRMCDHPDTTHRNDPSFGSSATSLNDGGSPVWPAVIMTTYVWRGRKRMETDGNGRKRTETDGNGRKRTEGG